MKRKNFSESEKNISASAGELTGTIAADRPNRRYQSSFRLLFLIGCFSSPLFACGPNFPNNLLDQGDAAVLVAPTADFAAELERMHLVPSRFQAVPLAEHQNHTAQAGQAESADLAAALRKAKVPGEQIEKICERHRAGRASLSAFLDNSWPVGSDDTGDHQNESERPKPIFPRLEIADDLPAEFSDYLEGALAWHNPAVVDKSPAREAWKRLLARPPQDRRFKSTWAAFMLGKAVEADDADQAVSFFRQVRDLAKHGFADSVGLAAASLGLEARVELTRKNYERAIELYLEQLGAGDDTAAESLRIAGAEALHESSLDLGTLAKNPRVQRVLTAYLISHRNEGTQTDESGEKISQPNDLVKSWLAALEAAGVRDVASAEKLGLAAYQRNEVALAQRWIDRAGSSPTAQWLQAKLLLRAGKLEQATTLLARVVHLFPIEPPDTNQLLHAEFKDNLAVTQYDCAPDSIPVQRQVLGELGVLRLTRREYSQALDALLHAGFWLDAAYVAERVLTLDELKSYVDRSWPSVSAEQVAAEKEQFGQRETCPALLREQIRYLLARRLTRSIRGDEARAYYPAERVSQFDDLARALTAGWDASLSATQRATALFTAAIITRTNGMELLGTELEPDWAIHGGAFESGFTWAERATNLPAAKVVAATPDEIHRASHHNADPEERFHYRYQAAFLAWEAAKLMPNNSEETARVLCTAGSWLKARNPETADIFYKALVRRNRQTSLGAEADRRRWFPDIGLDGTLVAANPVVESPAPEAAPLESTDPAPVEASTESAEPQEPGGLAYVVNTGDSIIGIARRLAAAGVSVTAQEILAANPGVVPTRIMAGQKLLIPTPKP